MTIAKRIPSKRLPKIDLREINLPDYADNTAVTIFGDYILFVEALYDQDCSNPCEDFDGVGSVRSLSNRHINNIDIEEATELLENDKDVVALSYYEHGNSMWMVQGGEASRTPGIEFQWDGTRFAGVWIPDTCVRESYMEQDGLTRREWMVKQAESACEQYTEWANGQCFGYDVKTYKLKVEDDEDGEEHVYEDSDDYRFAKTLSDDACFGFIGWEYFAVEMKDAAHYAVRQTLKGAGYSERAIATAFKKVEGK